MKFFILVKNEKYGEIKSETFETDPKDFDKIKEEIVKSSILDFFDDNGDFVIVPENTLKDSLIYLVKV